MQSQAGMTEYDFHPLVHNALTPPRLQGLTPRCRSESETLKIIVPEKESKRKKPLYECVSLCLYYGVAAGSVSPLSQAVLPVQLGRFLLPGGIRLRKTFEAG